MNETINIGDTVTMEVERPLNALDRILWKLFRIQLKREIRRETFVCQASGTSGGPIAFAVNGTELLRTQAVNATEVRRDGEPVPINHCTRIGCLGRFMQGGDLVDGCGEPCSYTMRKSGEGIPAFLDDNGVCNDLETIMRAAPRFGWTPEQTLEKVAHTLELWGGHNHLAK